MPSVQSGGVANGIGQPVRRKEDFRLLTGKGRYGDDVALPEMAHAVFVRSPHAHARMTSIDKRAAFAAPGALAVLTGADYAAAGLGPIPHSPGLSAPPDVQARLVGGANHCQQRLPDDFDQFGGILCRGNRLGDDDRDWLADKTHSVCRQGVMAGGNWRAAD